MTAPVVCHYCGAEGGAFREVTKATADGPVKAWECLSHSPRLGQLDRRARGVSR